VRAVTIGSILLPDSCPQPDKVVCEFEVGHRGYARHVAFQTVPSILLVRMTREAAVAIPGGIAARVGVRIVARDAGEFPRHETFAELQPDSLVAQIDGIFPLALSLIAMAFGAEPD
jgi:hypothetical protein